MTFTEYIELLPQEIHETIQKIHTALKAMGFAEEIKEAKSGPVLSYLKDKKVLLNYVYRKSGIKVRLYAAGISKYEERLADLPDKMKAELKKATDCKKLNGLSCTPTCPGGYTYSLDGEMLKKCRSMAFLMTLNPKTAEHVYELVLCEARERLIGILKGNTMKDNVVIYIHGKGGNADEAGHYKTLFPDCDVIGLDYHAETPWDAKAEFTEYFDIISKDYNSVILIANSIGAFFTMNAYVGKKVETAFFISPIVDMEKLITDMMMWAGVTEDDLHQKKEIATAFGETLSWDYFCYVKKNPIKWAVPTHILYGEKDNLTSFDTVKQFSEKIGAPLNVMTGGEHWFHTKEQMDYIDQWIRNCNE